MKKLSKEEKITLQTYNSNARHWFKRFNEPSFWEKERKKFEKLLPKGKILEIGCGTGKDAKDLIASGYEYTGIDIAQNLLEIAKRENPGAIFRIGSLYDLHFPKKENFDGFWCAATLLHIPKEKISEALHSIRGCIKKDGIGFISIVKGVGEALDERIIGDVKDARFFARYSKKGFSEILKDNHFKVIKTKLRRVNEKLTWLCFFVKTA